MSQQEKISELMNRVRAIGNMDIPFKDLPLMDKKLILFYIGEAMEHDNKFWMNIQTHICFTPHCLLAVPITEETFQETLKKLDDAEQQTTGDIQ